MNNYRGKFFRNRKNEKIFGSPPPFESISILVPTTNLVRSLGNFANKTQQNIHQILQVFAPSARAVDEPRAIHGMAPVGRHAGGDERRGADDAGQRTARTRGTAAGRGIHNTQIPGHAPEQSVLVSFLKNLNIENNLKLR